MFDQFDVIVLKDNLPEHNMFKGDVGTIVEIYDNGEAFEVEFASFLGETIATIALQSYQIRKINNRDMMTVRELC